MPSAGRLALNEQIFRAVNDQIAALSSTSGAPQRPGFVCECSRMDCTETLSMELQDYTEMRSRKRQYVLIAGHQLEPLVERVIAERGDYLIVEKLITAA